MAAGTAAAICGGVNRMPPPMTFDTMIAPASNAVRRRSSDGEAAAGSAREGARRTYWVSSLRSIVYSPIFCQLREPCLPKISTRASTNWLLCSMSARDSVLV